MVAGGWGADWCDWGFLVVVADFQPNRGSKDVCCSPTMKS